MLCWAQPDSGGRPWRRAGRNQPARPDAARRPAARPPAGRRVASWRAQRERPPLPINLASLRSAPSSGGGGGEEVNLERQTQARAQWAGPASAKTGAGRKSGKSNLSFVAGPAAASRRWSRRGVRRPSSWRVILYRARPRVCLTYSLAFGHRHRPSAIGHRRRRPSLAAAIVGGQHFRVARSPKTNYVRVAAQMCARGLVHDVNRDAWPPFGGGRPRASRRYPRGARAAHWSSSQIRPPTGAPGRPSRRLIRRGCIRVDLTLEPLTSALAATLKGAR